MKLEICVDCLESALRAEKAGADRLELCGELLVGGLSPSPFLIRQVLAAVKIPVNVLLRPRFGDFRYSEEEKDVLLEEIALCARLGASGVVIGALEPEGGLDVEFLSECMARAGGLTRTLHRCFDVCREPERALEQAIGLGFDTILTSGQAAKAPQGLKQLARLRQLAGERIHIMAGSGVTAENIPQIFHATGITQYHLSARTAEPGPMRFRREGVPMGLPMASEYDRYRCDPTLVRRARTVLSALESEKEQAQTHRVT